MQSPARLLPSFLGTHAPRKCPSEPRSDPQRWGQEGRPEEVSHFFLHKAIFKPVGGFHDTCGILNVTVDPFGHPVGILT